MRLRRSFIVTGAVVCAAAAGVASASVLLPGNDTVGGPADVQPDGGPVHVSPGVPDPDGGPDWAVRVYQSRSGLTCPEAGRFDGVRFGFVRADGQVAPIGVQAAGSCSDMSKNPLAFAVNRYPARGSQPDRTAVFGVVSPKVVRVTIKTPNGDQPVKLDDTGAFIAVIPALTTDGYTLEAGTTTGETLSYPLSHGG